MKAVDIPSKKRIIDDFKKVLETYEKEFPNSTKPITRIYYRKHGKFSDAQWSPHYPTFEDMINSIIGDSFSEKKKILILEGKVKELESQNDELLKNSITSDNLIQDYKNCLLHKYEFPFINKEFKLSSNKVLVLNLSDFHLGEVVIPEEVNFTNVYNKDVCVERINLVFNKVIKYSKKIGISDLYIIINGDMISGGIHQELARNSDLNEIESTFFMQKLLTQKISEMSEFFNKIEVDCIVGNHSRILPGKPYLKEKVSMNYEYILANMMKLYFTTLQECGKNNKVIINVADSPFIVKKIKSLRFLITHGDFFVGAGTGGFAGIPFYSLCFSAAKMYGVLHQIGVKNETQFDHIIIGHLHTTTKIPLFNGGFCFVNGCGIGTNEYSLFKMKSVAKKEQTMFIIDDDGIDGEINIRF